jgi:hypothetical protein
MLDLEKYRGCCWQAVNMLISNYSGKIKETRQDLVDIAYSYLWENYRNYPEDKKINVKIIKLNLYRSLEMHLGFTVGIHKRTYAVELLDIPVDAENDIDYYKIHKIIDALDPSDSYLIKAKFGIGRNKVKYYNLAKMFHMSHQNIHCRLNIILSRIRHIYSLDDFIS